MVKFPNDACTATNGLIGTCLTSTECTSRYEISNLVLNKRNIQFGIEQNKFSKSPFLESHSYLRYARSGTSGGNCAAGFGVCCLGMILSYCIEFKKCVGLESADIISLSLHGVLHNLDGGVPEQHLPKEPQLPLSLPHLHVNDHVRLQDLEGGLHGLPTAARLRDLGSWPDCCHGRLHRLACHNHNCR